jgi:hypothetical protein
MWKIVNFIDLHFGSKPLAIILLKNYVEIKFKISLTNTNKKIYDFYGHFLQIFTAANGTKRNICQCIVDLLFINYSQN